MIGDGEDAEADEDLRVGICREVSLRCIPYAAEVPPICRDGMHVHVARWHMTACFAGGVGAPPDLDAAFDPIATVYGAESVRAWHDQHGLPPEAAAAQCCFRKLADVTAHLTQYAGLGPSHAGTGRGRA